MLKKKCKHTILIQDEDMESMASCKKCHKVFGKNNEYEFFNLIENDYYTTSITYIRKPGVTDAEIKQSYIEATREF
jgi:hypothetical protein